MTNYEKMLELTGVKATKEEVKTLAKLQCQEGLDGGAGEVRG